MSPGFSKQYRALREINEQAKHRKARLFQQGADGLRMEHLPAQQLDNRIRRYITAGIEQRVGAAPCARTHKQIEDDLSAYCEFHTRSVIGAVQNVEFRFASREHLNDRFDGEQLLYLSSAENQFISCDTGFNCVKLTEQGPRVHIIPALNLQNPATAVHALEAVIAPCSVVHPQG